MDMTTVQKREGSRKLQPDQNSLQQQLLRNTASDRALLVVAADRAMTRIRNGKRKAADPGSTQENPDIEAVSKSPTGYDDALVDPDSSDSGLITQTTDQTTNDDPASQAPDRLVTSAQMLDRAGELATAAVNTRLVRQAVVSTDPDTGTVGIAQLLNKAVDAADANAADADAAQAHEQLSPPDQPPVRVETELGEHFQHTIDQQIHSEQSAADKASMVNVAEAADLTRSDPGAAENRSNRPLLRRNSGQERTVEIVGDAQSERADSSAIGQDIASQAVPNAVPFQVAAPYRPLRRPRKRCGGLDHRYIESSATKARRALAWDDLRFRYGLLPTVEEAVVGDSALGECREMGRAKNSPALTTQVRRPRSTRRQRAPSYVNELARLDANPALGSRHKNPFEIYQLELPLPERKLPLRDCGIAKSSQTGRSAKVKISATNDFDRKLKNRSKWWNLSQTLLQRTSLAMIFAALMIAGIVLFQEPVIEKQNGLQEITTFKSPMPPVEPSRPGKSDAAHRRSPIEAGDEAETPVDKSKDETFTIPANVNTVASDEIIDLVGQIEEAEHPARVRRLQRRTTSSVVYFDPNAQTTSVAEAFAGIDGDADPHLFEDVKVQVSPAVDASESRVAQVNPVIRSYLGPTRAALSTATIQSRRRANSSLYNGVAVDRHPEVLSFEVRLSQQSMEIFNSSILAGDHLGGGREIAYLGVADALGKNALSFSMSPVRNRGSDVRPFSRKFDLSPMAFFKFDSRIGQPSRPIIIVSDKSLSTDKSTVPGPPLAQIDKAVTQNAIVTIP